MLSTIHLKARTCCTQLILFLFSLFTDMWMWPCKVCDITLSTRYELLKHFRLKHLNYGRKCRYTCPYADCYMSRFKWRTSCSFNLFQINLEFMRITTVPLTSKFIDQLDKYTDDRLKVFRHKGGTAGQKIHRIMALTAGVSAFFVSF